MTAKSVDKVIYAGKRKTAIARVILTPGEGSVTVNKKKIEIYFNTEALRTRLLRPFVITDTMDQYDVQVNVRGGGYSSQSDAVRHGIAKALEGINPAFRESLKKDGLLTRDARKKERKKPGQKGARKKFQFSKR